MTPDDLAARTARAVAAATSAGRDLGVAVTHPRVLYDVFSVIVHLAPSPVVVRVPTVLPPSYVEDPELQRAQQRSELSVAGWLADHGYPVVGPSPLVPREPVGRDGFSMTFWQLVEERTDAETDLPERIRQTVRLHAALRDYESTGDPAAAEPPFWGPMGTYVPGGLAALAGRDDLLPPTDLDRARREWDVIAPVLTSRSEFEKTFPGAALQTIHGDAPYYNMIATPSGELWSDFELVTVGAVESDLAMAGPAAVAVYDAVAPQFGSRTIDPDVLRVTEAAARLGVVATLAMVPQLPMLAAGMAPALDEWRATPPITTL